MEELKEVQIAEDKDLKLLSYIQRIETLLQDKKDIMADISETYRDAVADGYDRTAIAELIKLRTKDPDVIAAQNEIIDLYAKKIGMEL